MRSSPFIGAIRWDAIFAPADNSRRQAVESTLTPAQWMPRAPRCAVAGRTRIDFTNCATQSAMDEELVLARSNKIDFWAYVWYGEDSDLQNGWRLHQASTAREFVKWCMICTNFFFCDTINKDFRKYFAWFYSKNYQKTAAGNPMIFLISDRTTPEFLKQQVSAMRDAVRAARLPQPYITLLTYSPDIAPMVQADAAGVYLHGEHATTDHRYSTLAATTEAHWAEMAALRQAIVPTAMTGWDRRPRIEVPVPWEKSERAAPAYFEPGSWDEIGNHVRSMVQWITANPKACPSQTGLIYSWNEYDEGGSTLSPTLGGGDTILKAVGRALRRS